MFRLRLSQVLNYSLSDENTKVEAVSFGDQVMD